ncbi:MAG: right-handed parallel beta-helix repeat-containing protein [Kiritimatiellae bacterium]|nr:right-handed parallel beta-helix repeat-containing protein [Kiritimatiellia bacterium]
MRTLNEVQPHHPISDIPYDITNSGAFYLTDNLVGEVNTNGITILADNVRLDLNGFALIGVSGSKHGVAVQGTQHNVTVRNGVVRDWGSDGVSATEAVESTLRGIITYNNVGMGMTIGQNALVMECGAYKNGDEGIRTQNGSTVTRCKASDNTSNGFACFMATRIDHCTAARNGDNGIWVKDNCDVRQCTSTWNTNAGIIATHNCSVVDNHCGENGGAGVHIVGTGCRVDGNNLVGNLHGVQVSGDGQANLIIRNSAGGSISNGFVTSQSGDYFGIVLTPGDMGSNGFQISHPWANFEY